MSVVEMLPLQYSVVNILQAVLVRLKVINFREF